jgi:hypothetical protein
MELVASIFIALLTFSLGVISASYGAQISKSFETRKEVLEKMRDWIDIVLLHVNAEYQRDVLGKSPIDEQKSIELRVKRLTENIRWIAIAEGLRSKQLLIGMEQFINAVKSFDIPYGSDSVKNQDEHNKLRFNAIEKVERAAQKLHVAITHESVHVPFWLIPAYERPKSQPKWRILLWILGCVALVLILSYVIFLR